MKNKNQTKLTNPIANFGTRHRRLQFSVFSHRISSPLPQPLNAAQNIQQQQKQQQTNRRKAAEMYLKMIS